MDETEGIRRERVADINNKPHTREELEAVYGKGGVWDTKELSRDFEVIGFFAPFCVVKKKATGKKGSLMFQDHPRFYFEWKEGY
jgi:hypothetical protein